MPPERSVGVDSELELAMVELLINARSGGGKSVPLNPSA
jgi:hypothetical protein